MEDLVELMQFEALEDEVLDNMLLMLMRRPKRIRAEQYGRFNLDGMCAEDIKLNFRFEKDDLERLARALRIPAQVRTENRHATTAIEALCVCLRRLAYPNWLSMITIATYWYI